MSGLKVVDYHHVTIAIAEARAAGKAREKAFEKLIEAVNDEMGRTSDAAVVEALLRVVVRVGGLE